ncbi:hypothetical protein SGFS_055610 [Streptomyces graminofaciens]|uniref:Uncharacterized protein n=1 Tax=Streptomyces graminofaciens TaxID=68212 RepID=A0ABN5VLH8_9ACTN|nr:hypothetical protein SGFS_055610 [Streptomyces graminofaciens]
MNSNNAATAVVVMLRHRWSIRLDRVESMAALTLFSMGGVVPLVQWDDRGLNVAANASPRTIAAL